MLITVSEREKKSKQKGRKYLAYIGIGKNREKNPHIVMNSNGVHQVIFLFGRNL